MYDFSGISTNRLRYAIDLYDKGNMSACVGINCIDVKCPFSRNVCGNRCLGVTHAQTHYEAFKDELERREKDMNKMPELKAGMIVEIDISPTDKKLYINDEWLMSLKNNGWLDFKDSFSRKNIIRIYECVHYSKGYNACTEQLKLIWSRKSDKDIKIEELQKTANKILEQIEDLKNERN